MPIHVYWEDIKKSIIHCEFEPKWTLDEYYGMIDEAYQMTISVTHKVHIITDFTNSRVAPSQILSTGRHVQKHIPPNSGITVMVGASGFIKALLDVARKIFLKNVKIVVTDTIEEAHAIIHKHQEHIA